MDILTRILQSTRLSLREKKHRCSLSEVASLAEGVSRHRPQHLFRKALLQPGLSVIAEIKKASPSKGLICSDFDPVSIAREYQKGGASAISVLTEERYFLGHIDIMRELSKAVTLPLLQKDFIIDPYQIYEGLVNGASAVLLICAVLPDHELKEFIVLASVLGLDALVEVHNRTELDRAIAAESRIIGINNRDLKSFKTHLQTSIELSPYIPDHIVKISESGIGNRADVEELAKFGYDGILVGEALMRHSDRADLIKELREC